jgi:lactate permease
MRFIAAALPILVILGLMLAARWSAARAGVVGAGVALAIGMLGFGFPGATMPALGVAAALGGTVAEAGFTALTILWIIGPALGIHQLQLRTGAADVLRRALAGFAPDPRVLALLVAWFFVLFMEGAAGFGASVALAAPFLVAAGFRPVHAVTITLIGHAVGVSFGAVGTPIVPQVAATGATGLEIARATGIYHSLLGWLPLGVMLVLVQRSLAPEQRGPGIWGWAAAAYVCFAVPYTLLWAFVGPELPTLGGALFGGVLFVVLLRVFGRNNQAASRPTAHADAPVTTVPLPDASTHSPAAPSPSPDLPAPAAGGVIRAAAPYLVLVSLVLLTRLVTALREALQSVALAWELYASFAGSIQPFYHPGTMLLLGFVVGALLQRATLPAIAHAVADATRTLMPVAVALLAMLTLSRIMVHAGMTEALAHTAAAAAGSAWPAFAPFVGTLGTFVTGSATASNILFTDFQQETAIAVERSVVGVVGAQGFGAAVGNMICPHNVVAAGATVGLHGREGEILRATLRVTLAYAAAGGVLALWLS